MPYKNKKLLFRQFVAIVTKTFYNFSVDNLPIRIQKIEDKEIKKKDEERRKTKKKDKERK